jgi:hypothetical protein
MITKVVKSSKRGRINEGRPTDYRPEHCETVIRLGKEGKSKIQIAAKLGVNRCTLDNWAQAHPEFFDAITHARDLALAWWEDQGQKGLWDKSFNANAFRIQIMNRFPDDYRDKQTLEHKGIPKAAPVEHTYVIQPVRTLTELEKLDLSKAGKS